MHTTNTRIVCATIKAIICIVAIIMCRFGNSSASNSTDRHLHQLPLDIKSNILQYSTPDIDSDLLRCYFTFYHKMNKTQTEEMNQVIHSRLNKLTFDQTLRLSVFLKNQSLDEDAERLEKEAMQRTQKLKEEQLNHIICNQTTVESEYGRIVTISFSFRLQQIFKHLRDLNIDINGCVSLQQLYNGSLYEIRMLALCENGIHSLDLFRDLTECNALYHLNLCHNELSDINVLSGFNASQFTTLHLSYNKLTNIEILRGFNELKHLYLDRNKIKDVEPLAELKALETLYLSFNKIKNINPLRVLTQLNTLNLGSNSISDIGALKTLNTLEYLQLSVNCISDIEALRNLTNLSSDLHLSYNRIKDIEPLRKLTKVPRIYLGHGTVTNSTLFGMDNIILDIESLSEDSIKEDSNKEESCCVIL